MSTVITKGYKLSTACKRYVCFFHSCKFQLTKWRSYGNKVNFCPVNRLDSLVSFAVKSRYAATRLYGSYVRVHFWHPYVRAVKTIRMYG